MATPRKKLSLNGDAQIVGPTRKMEPLEASYEAYNTFAALMKYTTVVDANWQVIARATSDQGYRAPRSYLTPIELRALADEADLLRLAIEDVKATVKGEDWDLEVEEGVSLNPGAEKFLLYPDGENTWDTWAGTLIEEVMVVDAACIFPWFKGGRIERLEPVDGTTIRPVPDRETGRLPDPPKVCYEQYSDGRTVQFTKDTLWMMVVNRRVGTLRGFSPVEQVARRATVNITKVAKDLSRWMKGGTPAGLLGTPDGMPLEGDNGLKAYQKWIDNNMRRPAAEFLVQAVAGKPGFIPVPPVKIDREHEELLARIICKAAGSDPTSLVSDVNRATADAMARWAALRGVYPYLWFLKAIADRALPLAGFPGHRLRWKAHKNAEEQARRQQEVSEYESGLRSWEETRRGAGLEIEKKDIRGQHFIFVGKSIQAFDPLADPQAPPEPPLGFPGGEDPPQDPSEKPSKDGGGDKEKEPDPEKRPKGDEGSKPPLTTEGAQKACSCGMHKEGGGRGFYAATFHEAERADLRRWEAVAKKAIKAGRAPKEFRSESIPAWKRTVITKALVSAEIGTGVFKAGGVKRALAALGSGIGVSVSPRMRAHTKKGEPVFRKIFGPIARHITKTALENARRSGKLQKSAWAPDDVPPPSKEAWDDLVEWIEAGYQIGVDDVAKILGHGGGAQDALKYARSRAGALLGRSYDALSDAWVDNPSSKWSIANTIRDRANDLVSEAIEEGWTEYMLQDELGQLFDVGAACVEGRAMMIARTESGFAYNFGAGANYAANGVEYVLISDGGYPTSCTECNDADGNVWPLERFLENPLEHPNCSRVALPADAAEYDNQEDEE
jgi:hypothetical protein